jgi:hypothetical protein
VDPALAQDLHKWVSDPSSAAKPTDFIPHHFAPVHVAMKTSRSFTPRPTGPNPPYDPGSLSGAKAAAPGQA